MAECCGCIVGCEVCVDLWLLERDSCPICGTENKMRTGKIKLHRLDSAIMIVKIMEMENADAAAAVKPVPSPPGSLEDFEL